VGEYHAILRSEACVPVGHALNPRIAMVTGFSCHEDEEEALRRGEDGFRFFGYGLAHHYIFGTHKPGRTDIWQRFEQARPMLPRAGEHRGIGTPAQLEAHLRGFEEAGVDQVIFIQQGGRNRHEHICESLELFAAKVMPSFRDRHAAAERRKMRELEPWLEAALKRKAFMRPLADDEIPEIHALGRQIVQQMPAGARDGVAGQTGSVAVPLVDPAERA
jgi:hypothetical protein